MWGCVAITAARYPFISAIIISTKSAAGSAMASHPIIIAGVVTAKAAICAISRNPMVVAVIIP